MAGKLMHGGYGKCNLKTVAKKIRAARKKRPSAEFVPLHRHLLHLAADSARHGYCARAGREIRKANELTRKYPRSR